MRGNPQPQTSADHLASTVRGKILLADMNAVKTRSHGQIRAVIHDEFDRVSEAESKLPRPFQHLVSAAFLLAVLNQGYAAGNQSGSELRQSHGMLQG
jgi:hypothetical protein